ncbi:Rrf2 family transcriptional regulator [Planococcus sp. N028]|uniref:Rrf2 family transcriptional regulator n=1 Tax=Planococcus shixiaomingii TaxID=3058393 RepID=A0ABT8N5K2_9BACL|nr:MULTISPECIES: Rrf2 family transcriptional regulator [unclassified Planococcus (in: firmicutes)]MDN7243153.1 Rrf2 family transcriptional regulator [Planococcus sp. N028]WKA55097.1 Rrf2 family transcriptional regulator [Planococcus sp. N022]
MQLTKGVEQAICIIVLLATQESSAPLASDEISRRLGVSPSYLKKITRKLAVQGIVLSVSGTNGGVSLAKPLKEVTMLHLIEAMEGPIAMYPDTGLISRAFPDAQNAERGQDVLRKVFRQADQLMVDYFSKVTAADLLEEGLGTTELPRLDWNRHS